MSMKRRSVLKSLALAPLALPMVRAQAQDFRPAPGTARQFEMTTRIAVPQAGAATRVFVPVPAADMGDWAKVISTRFSGNAASARLVRDAASGAAWVDAQWQNEAAPQLEVVSAVALQDRAFGRTAGATAARLTDTDRAAYLQPSLMVPLDGPVQGCAQQVTAGLQSDQAKLQALYHWVIGNTYRDGIVRGCGKGDVEAMLRIRAEQGGAPMGGKCADINRLFVGLLRSVGIPARDIYGVRVAPSRFGYRSLGAGSSTVTKAQHCRAEAYLDGIGWFPVDPADVRKVMLEEVAGGLPMSDAKVVAARHTLYGGWEGNWLPYNDARDIRLADHPQGTLPFFMYPQTLVDGTWRDSLDPAASGYSIEARPVRL
jgi:transglutaminase-like putative cysteine protease